MAQNSERVIHKKTNLTNIKIIIAFMIGVILASSITVYATSYFAKDVKYTKKDKTEISVENALNELYSESTKNLSVEIINNSYTNGSITATTTKNYDYIIIAGCKWYWNKGYCSTSLTVTGDYESYINKFGEEGNNLNDQDKSDIAIIKNVKKDTVITLGQGNSAVYQNYNIVGVCIE